MSKRVSASPTRIKLPVPKIATAIGTSLLWLAAGLALMSLDICMSRTTTVREVVALIAMALAIAVGAGFLSFFIAH